MKDHQLILVWKKSLGVIYYYYYYSLIRAFHISVSRWFFTGVWVTAHLLKSPGLFSVFWLFSIMLSLDCLHPSSSPFSNPLVTVPNAPITIGIIVTSMFHSFFQFPSMVEVVILLFTFFQFILWSAGTGKSTILQVLFFFFSFFFFCWLLLGLVFWPRLDNRVYVKVPWEFMCVLF